MLPPILRNLPLAFVSTLLALSILAQASPTLAARFEQRLTGRVENVTGSALAGLGGSNGMTATVVIGVESTVSGTASPLGTAYTNAVLDFTVTVGGLQVTFSPPAWKTGSPSETTSSRYPACRASIPTSSRSAP